jgi:hypothetical protein
VPAVLKNALDAGSRPYGSSVWDRKPGAIVSGSPGAIGAFGANHHLRHALQASDHMLGGEVPITTARFIFGIGDADDRQWHPILIRESQQGPSEALFQLVGIPFSMKSTPGRRQDCIP